MAIEYNKVDLENWNSNFEMEFWQNLMAQANTIFDDATIQSALKYLRYWLLCYPCVFVPIKCSLRDRNLNKDNLLKHAGRLIDISLLTSFCSQGYEKCKNVCIPEIKELEARIKLNFSGINDKFLLRAEPKWMIFGGCSR